MKGATMETYTVEGLVDATRARGVTVSRRQVAEWTRAGLLPRPVRTPLPGQGRGRAPYRYPACALDAVRRLARWRRWLPRDPEQVRGWLWLSGCAGLDFDPDDYLARRARDWWRRWRADGLALPAPAAIVAGLTAEQLERLLDTMPTSNFPERFSALDSAQLALFGVVPSTMWAEYDHSSDRDREQGVEMLPLLYALLGHATERGLLPPLAETPCRPETWYRVLAGVSLPHLLQAGGDWAFMRAITATLARLADVWCVDDTSPVNPYVRVVVAQDPIYVMIAGQAVAATLPAALRAELIRGCAALGERLRDPATADALRREAAIFAPLMADGALSASA